MCPNLDLIRNIEKTGLNTRHLSRISSSKVAGPAFVVSQQNGLSHQREERRVRYRPERLRTFPYVRFSRRGGVVWHLFYWRSNYEIQSSDDHPDEVFFFIEGPASSTFISLHKRFHGCCSELAQGPRCELCKRQLMAYNFLPDARHGSSRRCDRSRHNPRDHLTLPGIQLCDCFVHFWVGQWRGQLARSGPSKLPFSLSEQNIY